MKAAYEAAASLRIEATTPAAQPMAFFLFSAALAASLSALAWRRAASVSDRSAWADWFRRRRAASRSFSSASASALIRAASALARTRAALGSWASTSTWSASFLAGLWATASGRWAAASGAAQVASLGVVMRPTLQQGQETF
jgi:hypothetical protein